MNDSPFLNVVIVGGGSAGWLTAGLIASKYATAENKNTKVCVTLIESPDVPIIGVGEGTWPSMRNTLKRIGISELAFLKYCGASFKQGSKFCGWSNGEKNDIYYHPFTEPNMYGRANIYEIWKHKNSGKTYAEETCFQTALCEHNLAPKKLIAKEFTASANYGYHFDAVQLGRLLHEHCVSNLGVNYISDHVTKVCLSQAGNIDSIETRKNGVLKADLFVDCTGSQCLLLGKTLGVPFVDCQYMVNDTAIAIQVPYETDDQAITSTTVATAQKSGWIWDIGLYNRRGTGYVYSSAHCGNDEAEIILRKYLASTATTLEVEKLESRKINIRSGHRRVFWQNNCVAVGMAAGFIEPLEASALAMIEMSANMIADEIPAIKTAMHICAKKYNQRFQYRWDRIIDFLKLHYVISKRTDSDYWQDVTDNKNTPESLQELLELWRFRPPYYNDLIQNQEVFPSASYQFVLYGMGFDTSSDYRSAFEDVDAGVAHKLFEDVRLTSHKLVSTLPSNREYLRLVHERVKI